jgi:hypothetical protein
LDKRLLYIESQSHHFQPERSYSPRSDRKRVKPTHLSNINTTSKRLNMNAKSSEEDSPDLMNNSERDDDFI